MKKTKWITSLFAMSVVLIMCVQFADYNAKQKYIEVSKGFSIPVGNYILMTDESDMDGDGKGDKVYVYGEKKNIGEEYAERINLAVVYAKNGFVKKTNVSYIKGYVCDVEVQDFTGNKNKDILLKIFTDEEKSVMSATVADFGYDIPKIIMADSRGISPSLSFLDEFAVNCSFLNGQSFSVNLENKKKELTAGGFFNENATLLSDVKVFAKPYYEISAIDADEDGRYELAGVQKVVAGKEETELFKIHSVQKFSGKTWNLVKIEVKY